MKQTQGGHTHIALGLTDIPHTRRPRAPPTPAGRKGSDIWDGNRTSNKRVSCTPCRMCKNAERNESRPAPKSGSRAPTDRSTALITSAPSLPTQSTDPPRRVRDMPRDARSRAKRVKWEELGAGVSARISYLPVSPGISRCISPRGIPPYPAISPAISAAETAKNSGRTRDKVVRQAHPSISAANVEHN